MPNDLISYLQSAGSAGFSQPMEQVLNRFVAESSDFNKYRQLGLPVYMVLDFRNDVFSFVSDNVYDYLGIPVAKVLRNKLSYWLKEQIHPNDFDLLNERIFPDVLRFLCTLPPGNTKQYGFNFEIRLKNIQGGYHSYLLKTILYSQVPDNKPLFARTLLYPQAKQVSDAEFSTTLFVEEYAGEENGMLPDVQKPVTIASVCYLPREHHVPLSTKEIRIIQLIARGLSSKEVAAKMLMSFESVRKYRKKIYAKLDIGRKSDLVAAASRLGIHR